jgi:putative GTP pyrophosphokinase
MELEQSYQARYRDILEPCAVELQKLLEGHLAGIPRVDRIAVRAKSPGSFLKKATKLEEGIPVYTDPLGEIQDQIGARVIVFYTSDVAPTSERIQRYFHYIERQVKEPKREAEFGYFGKHYILALPQDCVPPAVPLEQAPPVFELQVRTLFQHAWSEAEHDLAYKPLQILTPDQKRRFAFTAAQAWGADLIFQGLFAELGGRDASPESSESK